MAGVSIEVTGLDSVLAALGRLANPPMREAFDEIGQYMVSEITQQFRDGKGPDGRAWEKIGDIRRGVRGGGGKPLTEHGHLRDSYTHDFDDRELVVGSNDKRARLLNFGGVVRPRRAKYLSVPLTKSASEYSSPRKYPERLHVVETADGLFLAPDDGPMAYILLRSITMPARPVLPQGDLPPDWRDEVLDILQHHLQAAA